MVKVQYRDQVFELTKSETSGAPQAQSRMIEEYRDLRAENEIVAQAQTLFPYQNDAGLLSCDEEEQQICFGAIMCV